MKNYEKILWKKPGLFSETHWVRSVPETLHPLFFRCDGVFLSHWFPAYTPTGYQLPRTLYQLVLEGGYDAVDLQTGKTLRTIRCGDLIVSSLAAAPVSRCHLTTPLLRRIGVLVGVTPVHEQLHRMLFPESSTVLHPADPEPFRQAFEAIRSEVAGSGDLETLSDLIGALLQKIALLSRKNENAAGFRKLLQPESEREYRKVADLAAAAGLGARTLARRFQRELGTTPGHHLAQIRLEKALNMLAIPDLEIKEIAQACGYSSANFLIRCFKKAYGITPGAYRKNAKVPLPRKTDGTENRGEESAAQ